MLFMLSSRGGGDGTLTGATVTTGFFVGDLVQPLLPSPLHAAGLIVTIGFVVDDGVVVVGNFFVGDLVLTTGFIVTTGFFVGDLVLTTGFFVGDLVLITCFMNPPSRPRSLVPWASNERLGPRLNSTPVSRLIPV